MTLAHPANRHCADDVMTALRGSRFSFICESDLQTAMATVLMRHAIPFTREVRLDARNRIDFLVDGGIGIELKVDGSTSSVTRQLHRYAQRDEISALILVTSLKRHDRMPPTMNGKPVLVHHLIGSAL